MLVSNESIKLESTDGKLLCNINRYVDVITIRLDVVIELGSLYGSFDGSNNGKIEGLLLGESLGYTYVNVSRTDEGIKLGSIDDEVLVTIFGDVEVITIWLDFGTELGTLDGTFAGFNDGSL